MYGAGLMQVSDDTPAVRVLASLDLDTLAIAVVGEMPGGYVDQANGMAAVSATKRTFYWVGSKAADPTGAFHLLQYTLANASLVSVSAAPLCVGDGACPLNINYLDA
jgi:hypothetical protein